MYTTPIRSNLETAVPFARRAHARNPFCLSPFA
jgi:hypothetical protein